MRDLEKRYDVCAHLPGSRKYSCGAVVIQVLVVIPTCSESCLYAAGIHDWLQLMKIISHECD